MAHSQAFGRLLKMAVNGIATYEGKNAPIIEDELGQQIGLSVAAIQRYKSGHIPPEARTIQILAEAAVQRGRLDQRWLEEFLQAAQHPAPQALTHALFPPAALPIISPQAPVAPVDQNRSRMLEKVHAFWIDGILQQSLHGAVLLELGLEEHPDAVVRPWDVVVQQPERPTRSLPLGTPLVTIFDECDQALLVLGAPGAGKTTMLLELARDLLARAHTEPQHPIPVVFNLSTWNGQHHDLAAWLIHELHMRYQVPRRVSEQWVAQAQILPLLDGLDEVSLERRAECVAAINRFRQHHGLLGIAVASRIADYELLANKLQLHGAVLIQPLSMAQIERYTAEAGPALAGMRQALRDDQALRELAETPLMLSIMSLAYQGEESPVFDRPAAVDERRFQLFETYIQRMFERRTAAAPAPPHQVRRWLGWLAHQLTSRDQTVFFLEGLQPSWLGNSRQQLFFSALTGILMGIVAAVLSLLGIAIIRGLSFLSITAGLSMVGLVVALLGVWLGSRARTRFGAYRALGLGLGGASLCLAMFAYRQDDTPFTLLLMLAGVGISALLGGAIGLIGGLVRLARSDNGETMVKVVETLHWTREQATSGWIAGLIGGQALGFWLGWNSASLTGTWFQLLTAMLLALFFGLGLGLIGGLVTGLVGNQVEVRTRPNQGIHESARYMLRGMLAGPVVALVLGPILAGGVLLSTFFSNPSIFFAAISAFSGGFSWDYMLTSLSIPLVIIAFAPLLGALIALASGGVACLQHSVLRLLLVRHRTQPFDYVRLLDYAVERLLLRKVGGGYMFVHRLLLEHIAATDGQAWHGQTQSPSNALGQPTIRLVDEGQTTRLQRRSGAPTRAHWFWPKVRRIATAVALSSMLLLLLATISISLLRYTPSPNQTQVLHSRLPLVALAQPDDRELWAIRGDGQLQRWWIEGGEQPTAQMSSDRINQLQPWTTHTGTMNSQMFINSRYAAKLAPNGQHYVVMSYAEQTYAELRRSQDGVLIARVTGNTAVFSPDSQLLAVIEETYQRRISLWRVSDGAQVSIINTQGDWVSSVAFSPDGDQVVIGTWQGLNIWRVRDGQWIRGFALDGRKNALSISADQQLIAIASYDMAQIVRLSDGALLHTLRGHENSVFQVAFSPDGRTLATGGYDRTVRLWRSSDGALLQVLRGHMAEVTDLAFSADGRMLASSSLDHTVRLWQVGP